MKIVVLCGGLSMERNVSIASSALVCRAMRELGHRAVLVDMFFGLEDCEETFGDVLFEKLKFRGGSLAGLAGRPVVVRFFLRQADLFAYRFA